MLDESVNLKNKVPHCDRDLEKKSKSLTKYFKKGNILERIEISQKTSLINQVMILWRVLHFLSLDLHLLLAINPC